ncbi:MAG TPA: PilN domain-containing protein [Phycisphaerae bacterium]|nr:PilN domain-containing protein [Phycisphaerae bacterium]
MSQMTNTSMNFLPEDYVEKRQAARTAVICVGLLVVVVSGIVATWWYKEHFEAKNIYDYEARVNAQFEEANKQIQEVQEIDREKAKMMQKAELTTMLMEKVRRSALLEELARLQPRGVNLVSLELKSREIIPPPMSEADKLKRTQAGLPPEPEKPPELEVKLDLTGTAVTDGQVTQYVGALNKSSLLSDVNLIFAEETKRGTGDDAETFRKFHVEMRINPKADLRQLSGSDSVTAAANSQ